MCFNNKIVFRMHAHRYVETYDTQLNEQPVVTVVVVFNTSVSTMGIVPKLPIVFLFCGVGLMLICVSSDRALITSYLKLEGFQRYFGEEKFSPPPFKSMEVGK